MRRWWPVGLSIGLGLLWWFVMVYGVRPLFEAAYHDIGPAWLNGFITPTRSLDTYLTYVDRFAITTLVAFALAALWCTARQYQRETPWFYQRFVGPAAPEALAMTRIVTAGILLTSTLWEDLASTALLPRDLIAPPGVISWFYAMPGFDDFVASALGLGRYRWLVIAVLLLALAGVWTRLTVALATVSYLLLAGLLRQYTWSYHIGLIPIYVMAILAFTRCGDAWSIDRWWAIRRGRARPITDAVRMGYGWGQFAVVLIIVLPYTAAGLSKLYNGVTWWYHPDNMRYILYMDTLNPMEFDWGLSLRLAGAPDAVFILLGLAAVLGEAAMISVLFSKAAKCVMPAVMIGMHLGIWLLQNILFFDLIILCTLLYAYAYTNDTYGPWALWSKRWRPLPPPATPLVLPATRWPAGLQGLTALLVVCWALAIEYFPLTAMQMYAIPNVSGTVSWYRVVARTLTGEVSRAYPEAVIPALKDSRYRRVSKLCFEPEQRQVCERFLQTTGRLLNAQIERQEPIEALEVQRWKWNFRARPRHPDHGEIEARYRVRVLSPNASAQSVN